jgi:serine protease Do
MISLHGLKKSIPDQYFWHYPLPQEIGIEMDPQEVATIRTVQAGSHAARAGLHVGDKIKHINDQPILSTADIQWVLHHAKSPDTLSIDVERSGEPESVELQLEEGWRLRMGDWRYLNQLMQGYLANFRAQPADPATRKKLGLADDDLAFELSWVNTWRNRPVYPLLDGDVIIGINGNRKSMQLGEFTARLFRDAREQTLQLTVIRQGQRKTVDIKLP